MQQQLYELRLAVVATALLLRHTVCGLLRKYAAVADLTKRILVPIGLGFALMCSLDITECFVLRTQCIAVS
jgi:hypothetical protein